MADFRVTFPVAGVDGLDESVELVEVVQFVDSCDFVLDVAGKSVVELVAENSVTPIDFGGELLKADNVFSNFPVLTHFELFKLSFSIGFNVKWAKVSPEFEDKFDVVIGPGGVGIWVH